METGFANPESPFAVATTVLKYRKNRLNFRGQSGIVNNIDQRIQSLMFFHGGCRFCRCSIIKIIKIEKTVEIRV